MVARASSRAGSPQSLTPALLQLRSLALLCGPAPATLSMLFLGLGFFFENPAAGRSSFLLPLIILRTNTTPRLRHRRPQRREREPEGWSECRAGVRRDGGKENISPFSCFNSGFGDALPAGPRQGFDSAARSRGCFFAKTPTTLRYAGRGVHPGICHEMVRFISNFA